MTGAVSENSQSRESVSENVSGEGPNPLQFAVDKVKNSIGESRDFQRLISPVEVRER